jgi:acetyl esterase/lipase
MSTSSPALALDPEVAIVLGPLLRAMAAATPPPVHDWRSRRASVDRMFLSLAPAVADPTVTTSSWSAPAPDGHAIPMRLYRAEGAQPGSLVVYVHGGGMFLCSLETHDPICRRLVAESGVPVLSVDFRFAPEHPFPASVEDCYAALCWAVANAAELGIDPARVAVMGDSAGGGMAAGVALMARDRGGPALAAQVLVYPMLDDRTTTAPATLAPLLTWSVADNVTGWGCLLGTAAGGPDVSPYAAPARATTLEGLPRTFLDVGQLDLFCAEDLAYAARLDAAGVPVEFHLYPGCPHAFEVFAPAAEVSRRAIESRARFLRSL